VSKRRGSYLGGSTIMKGTPKQRVSRARYRTNRIFEHIAKAKDEKARVASLWASPTGSGRRPPGQTRRMQNDTQQSA
jgi:hypothetical protein